MEQGDEQESMHPLWKRHIVNISLNPVGEWPRYDRENKRTAPEAEC